MSGVVESAEGLRRFRPYPEYRESGIEWLDSLPVHWTAIPIRGLARPGYKTFTDGDWIESPYIRDDGIRLLQTGNVGTGFFKEQGYRYIDEDTFDAFRCTEVLPGDVLICRLAAPVGRACIAPDLGKRMITSVDVCILKLQSGFDPRFVVYALSQDAYLSWLGAICRGGTRDRVSRSMLGAIRLPVPALVEQRAIAAFLDRETTKIDALVAKKERLIELLQEKRTALVTHAVTKGLDPNVPMKPSGVEWLGEIPAHWEVKPSRSLFRDTDRRSETGDEELLTVSHLTGVTPRSEKNVTMIEALSHEGYKICEEGNLVINTLWGWMGALGIAWQRGIVSPAYNVYQLSKSMVPHFVDYYSRTPANVCDITRHSKGIWKSRLRIYPDDLREVLMVVPPISEQLEIAAYLDRQLREMTSLESKVREGTERLREYRTALISAAVTGEIDVRKEANAA